MRLIDADLLLLYIGDIEITGAGLRNRTLTNAFRREFAEVINSMPVLDTTKDSHKCCQNCGCELTIAVNLERRNDR